MVTLVDIPRGWMASCYRPHWVLPRVAHPQEPDPSPRRRLYERLRTLVRQEQRHVTAPVVGRIAAAGGVGVPVTPPIAVGVGMPIAAAVGIAMVALPPVRKPPLR